MARKNVGFASVDEYIANFPNDVQAKLEELRAIIKAAAPEAEERISYQMPAFAQEGNLVLFAAFKRHIEFFGTSIEMQEVVKGLSTYAGPKGSLKFPYDEPFPLDVIRAVVKLRVAENLRNAEIASS